MNELSQCYKKKSSKTRKSHHGRGSNTLQDIFVRNLELEEQKLKEASEGYKEKERGMAALAVQR